MARRKRHWVDEVADDLRERVKRAVPAVAEGLRDDVPVGYEPPRVKADEADQFLAMDGNQRLELFRSMGSEEYQQYTTQLMRTLTQRYGAAAQVLMPLLEATEMQARVEDMPAMMPPDPVSAARQQLTEYLGVDPFGV